MKIQLISAFNFPIQFILFKIDNMDLTSDRALNAAGLIKKKFSFFGKKTRPTHFTGTCSSQDPENNADDIQSNNNQQVHGEVSINYPETNLNQANSKSFSDLVVSFRKRMSQKRSQSASNRILNRDKAIEINLKTPTIANTERKNLQIKNSSVCQVRAFYLYVFLFFHLELYEF